MKKMLVGGGYSEDEIPDISKIKVNENAYNLKDTKARETANAALPKASYTAADILNKLKAVDGDGSGLDADLFKGEDVVPVANGGTGSSAVRKAIRNVGDLSNVFIRRLPSFDSGVSENDMNSLTVGGVLLTDAANVENSPEFFDATGRRTLACFGVDNSGYNGYLAFDWYSQEIAARMGIESQWRRLATDKNMNEMINAALEAEDTIVPVSAGGTGASNADTARENLNAFRMISLYINPSYPGGFDIDTDEFDFILLSLTHSLELQSVLGGLFAYVWQFYYSNNKSAQRVQFAHGHTNNKIATRYYYNDWSDWELIATESSLANMMNSVFASNGIPVITVAPDTAYTTAKVRNIQASTTDLTAGTSALANGDIYLVYE